MVRNWDRHTSAAQTWLESRHDITASRWRTLLWFNLFLADVGISMTELFLHVNFSKGNKSCNLAEFPVDVGIKRMIAANY